MKSRNITFTTTLFMLALFGVAAAPKAFGVVPPPDGGYANFTTAEGQNALFSLTSGAANTAVGWFSLKSVTAGSFNTGVGAGALVLNTGDANTAMGTAALLLNTMGTQNTANGTATLVNNSTGSFNSAFGAFALNTNVDGNDNTAVGVGALSSNTFGGGLRPSAVKRSQAKPAAAAARPLVRERSQVRPTASPILPPGLWRSKTPPAHAIRPSVLERSATALPATTSPWAPKQAPTSPRPATLSVSAPMVTTWTTAAISARSSVQPLPAERQSSSIQMANLAPFNRPAASKKRSSRWIKRATRSWRLQPVTFRYKKEFDPAGIAQFGLVAEEVEKVNPDLVVRDKDGKP